MYVFIATNIAKLVRLLLECDVGLVECKQIKIDLNKNMKNCFVMGEKKKVFIFFLFVAFFFLRMTHLFYLIFFVEFYRLYIFLQAYFGEFNILLELIDHVEVTVKIILRKTNYATEIWRHELIVIYFR